MTVVQKWNAHTNPLQCALFQTKKKKKKKQIKISCFWSEAKNFVLLKCEMKLEKNS